MLRLFLLESDMERGVHVREITRKVGTEINAVRRELDRLMAIKMLKREERGNRVYYVLRDDFPLKAELLGLLIKEDGFASQIIKQSKKLGQISFAIISKEFVHGDESKGSEVDLFFVGKINEYEVESLIKEEEARRKVAINVSFLSEDEFEYMKSKKEPFVISILTRPYYMLIGDDVEFSQISRKAA